MLRIDRAATLFSSLFILIAGLDSEKVFAEINGLGEDGWHTWQVEAVETAPDMCCFSWRSGSVTKKQCNLDGRRGGFSSSDESASAGNIQVFAFVTSGEATKIRVFDSSCPVVANSAITDLGPIEADDSVEWLEKFIANGNAPGSDAIIAIAVHDGRKARDVLIETAQPGNPRDHREEALFWMGQVRLGETRSELKNYIFNDASADIRAHAAFSYSQSKADDIADVLIQQGKTDETADVRSQAWFWLAQTEADESEEVIHNALLHDKDGDVREEAVFALSQLPEDRAIKALARILEDRQIDMDLREQALFWLAQTESEEAFEYIDRLLSEN